jgi:hypothetical protein
MDTEKPIVPAPRRFTMSDGGVYEEVTMKQWNVLDDHSRDIIQAGLDTVFVRIVQRPRSER